MKRFFMSSSLLLVLGTFSYAQTTSSAQTESPDLEEEPQSDASARATDSPQDAPYFLDRWVEGQVTMEGGTEYENVPLKFNILRNELITKEDDGREVVLDDARSFTLGPPRLANLSWFKRAKYLDNFTVVPNDQFVQVIYEGESWLVAVPGQPVDSTDASAGVMTQYYFMSPDKKITPFTPDRTSMIDLLRDKKETVTEFIDAAELDLNNVADLARLIAHYDQH